MAEGTIKMLIHGAMAGVAAFGLITASGQPFEQAVRNSVLVSKGVSSYMILFGHGLPY
jgi:hypothetical protein